MSAASERVASEDVREVQRAIHDVSNRVHELRRRGAEPSKKVRTCLTYLTRAANALTAVNVTHMALEEDARRRAAER